MRAWIGILLAAWQCATAQEQPATEAVAIQLTSARLARVPPPGVNTPRVVVETESQFLTTDLAAWYLVTYNGGHKGDKIRVEWRSPLGAVVQQNDHVAVNDGLMRLNSRLLIAGGPASFAPGDWKVLLFWNDHGIAVSDFRISPPPESAVTINGRGLLPAATVATPYYFQFTAKGGRPPYQWTALKALPDGLTISPSGAISGAPRARGSYRLTVQAKDADGTPAVRTVGMGVGTMSPNARAAVRNLLKAAVPDPCSESSPQMEFSGSDANVVLAASLEASGGREGRVEWLNPRGEVYLLNRIAKPAEGKQCVMETMPLAGHRAAQDPGDWRVRLLWNDLEVFTLKFSVSAAKGAGGRSGGGPAGTVAARSGRVAVVIGNLKYEKLPAGTADLDLLESALRQDGFEVVRKADVSLDDLRLIERTLDETLQAGDTALVYYSGYDVRSGGDDWLLPVNYDPGDPRPIQSKAYSTLRLMQLLEDSKAGLKFIFLDGAAAAGQPRENPGAVLGEVDDSTALVYSSPPGGASKAGSAAPGVFARALAEVLDKPGLDARTALGLELPKAVSRMAPSSPAPMAIMGGGADFVFRPAAAPHAAKP